MRARFEPGSWPEFDMITIPADWVDALVSQAREGAERCCRPGKDMLILEINPTMVGETQQLRIAPVITVREDDPNAYPYGNFTRLDAILTDVQTLPHVWFVQASGLAQQPIDVQWFWRVDLFHVRRQEIYSVYRIGSAAEMVSFARRNRVELANIYACAADDIHGTCVFESGPQFDDNDQWVDATGVHLNPYQWRMTQAHSYLMGV